MSAHHETLSPSAMPMLEACPCFERDPGGVEEYRDTGNRLHKAFGNLLEGKDTGVLLTMKEAEDIDWAVGYVKATRTMEYPLEVEKRLTLSDRNFKIITFGTADVINGGTIFDLKTMEAHNYDAQMSCYALMKMQRDGDPFITVDILYSRDHRVERLVVDREEAEARISKLMLRVYNPSKKPVACEFCNWCKNIKTCPAVVGRVMALVKSRSEWELEHYNPAEITDPAEMAKALTMARTIAKWAESVEEHAKQMTETFTIPGFTIKEKAGAREVIDVGKAFQLSGLEPEEFLALCKISIGPLEEALAKKEGMTLAAAKKAVNERLEAVLQRRPPSFRLEPEKKTKAVKLKTT